MINLAIFASGNGTNAENIIRYFSGHSWINVAVIVTNNKDAFVLKRAGNHNIPGRLITSVDLQDEDTMNDLFDMYQVDYIILAGFLKKILCWTFFSR